MVSNQPSNPTLGAVLRDLLPQLTGDNEIIHGSIPDPTVAGVLPDGTQQRWHGQLYGRVPMMRRNVFAINGQTFSTGGYAYWDRKIDCGSISNVMQSGVLTNLHTKIDTYVTWLETTFKGQVASATRKKYQ